MYNLPENLFEGLEFDEPTHTYWMRGIKKNSTTRFLKKFVNEFDLEGQSTRVAKREGLTQHQVKELWNFDAFFGITKGNKTHFFSEDYVDGKRKNPSCASEAGVIQFWNDLPKHLHFVKSELRMYSEVLDICGTCDILLFNSKTGKYILVDYKTNKDLFTSYGLLKLFPESIPDNNYNKYSLQLSTYQIMLEENDIEIEDRLIVWTKRSNTKMYQIHKAKDYRHYILNAA